MYEFVVQERSDTQHVAVVHICMGSCTAGDYVNAEEAFQEQRLAPGVKAEDDQSGVEKPRKRRPLNPEQEMLPIAFQCLE